MVEVLHLITFIVLGSIIKLYYEVEKSCRNWDFSFHILTKCVEKSCNNWDFAFDISIKCVDLWSSLMDICHFIRFFFGFIPFKIHLFKNIVLISFYIILKENSNLKFYF